jgi:hypothetical protein
MSQQASGIASSECLMSDRSRSIGQRFSGEQVIEVTEYGPLLGVFLFLAEVVIAGKGRRKTVFRFSGPGRGTVQEKCTQVMTTL